MFLSVGYVIFILCTEKVSLKEINYFLILALAVLHIRLPLLNLVLCILSVFLVEYMSVLLERGPLGRLFSFWKTVITRFNLIEIIGREPVPNRIPIVTPSKKVLEKECQQLNPKSR